MQLCSCLNSRARQRRWPACRSRRAKIEEISALLAAVPSGEVPVAVAFLSGELRQRQIGVGYAALGDLFPPAGPATGAPAEPALTAGRDRCGLCRHRGRHRPGRAV